MGVTVAQGITLEDRASVAARRWSLRAELAALHDSFVTALAGGYRPELHYMRGPGPKWREKHASAVPQTGVTPLFHEGIPA
jgi:hypothetical protein